MNRVEPLDLEITTSLVDGRTVVRVAGEIDVYTAPQLRERLDQEIEGGVHDLVVDLSGVTFMDSTGLGVLVGRLKQIRLNDGSMRLVCAHDRVLKVFVITGLDKVFALYPTVDEALSA
jgi:anti-sigma B factor antagonist